MTEEEKPSAGAQTAPLRRGRILLTEDNELNQEIAEAILTEAGFEIEIADNGQLAVEMLKASQPGYYQLILMDVQMPVMNGYEATRAIRALERPDGQSIPHHRHDRRRLRGGRAEVSGRGDERPRGQAHRRAGRVQAAWRRFIKGQ